MSMRELETSLQQFGEFLLRAKLVTPRAAPYCVRWVRTFLNRAATDEPIADQVRHFCEALERDERREEWQAAARGLAPPRREGGRRCRRQGEHADGDGAYAPATPEPPLCLSHRGQLRGLGTALSRLPGRAAGAAGAAQRHAWRPGLPHPSGREAPRVQARFASAGRAQRAGDCRTDVSGSAARPRIHRVPLSGSPSRLRPSPA